MYTPISMEWEKLDKVIQCIRNNLGQCNEKSLMKLSAMSVKTLKTLKCLPYIFFNMDVMDLYSTSFFCILFNSRLESITKVLLLEVILAKLKNSESIHISKYLMEYYFQKIYLLGPKPS